MHVHLPPHQVFTHVIIHATNYCTCYMTGTVLGTGHITGNEADSVPHGAYIQGSSRTGSHQCTHAEEAHMAGVECPAHRTLSHPFPSLQV